MDDLDRKLLNELQQGVPLAPSPLREIGRRIGVGEHQVIDRVRRLREGEGVIRQISAIFDTAALGYASSLVAVRVDDERVEDAAAIINEHPGVSHNYRRAGNMQIWFTLAVPPDSRLGLEGVVDVLKRQTGAAVMRLLPTLTLFKIGVKLDLADREDEFDVSRPAFSAADREAATRHPITERDKRAIRVLQQDLPLTPEPFADWAAEAGMSADQLLTAGRRFLERRQMRRFAAVLRHRRAGFAANVMGVWRVPCDEVDHIGPQMAEFRQVSHCYLRPSYDDWPYNVYTMVHARTRDEAAETLDRISQATGISDYRPLWTTQEFKKVRVRYFTGEILEWEKQHAST